MGIRLWMGPPFAMITAVLSVVSFPSLIPEGSGWWQWVSVAYVTSLGLLMVTFLILGRTVSKAWGRMVYLPISLRNRRRWQHLVPLLLAGGVLLYLAIYLPFHALIGTLLFGSREWMIWQGKRKAIADSMVKKS